MRKVKVEIRDNGPLLKGELPKPQLVNEQPLIAKVGPIDPVDLEGIEIFVGGKKLRTIRKK